jgi:hypothetical protein
MGIGEEHASFRKSIDVGRLDLRVPLEASHPIVQIVDRDIENIRAIFFCGAEFCSPLDTE